MGKKKKKKQSKTVGDLIYFDAGQYVTNILHGLFVGFFVLKSLVSICLNNHFVFYSPSAFFFFLFLLPILFCPFISPFSCCKQDITEFQSLSSHK